MIAILQRVSEASVAVEGEIVGQIDKGLFILLGVTHTDTEEDVLWLSQKIVQMRIFQDDEDKMNRSIKDIGGSVLLVSQFTLHSRTKKGNRPSFVDAAKPDLAKLLYDKMIEALSQELGKPIQTGKFGHYMHISVSNDGPVTIYMDTKNKK